MRDAFAKATEKAVPPTSRPLLIRVKSQLNWPRRTPRGPTITYKPRRT